jgi:hypothetical protein
MAAAKKEKEKANALEDVALVAVTQQNLSNLYSLDFYDLNPQPWAYEVYELECFPLETFPSLV